jgi:hypothetical protein
MDYNIVHAFLNLKGGRNDSLNCDVYSETVLQVSVFRVLKHMGLAW